MLSPSMSSNDEVARIFAQNLKRSRKFMRMSQDELAWRASIHRTEVSQLERALRVPRLDTIVKLQASLEAEPEELLKDIIWRPGSYRYGSFQVAEPEVRNGD
jgi:transcriptional regulator with XRE-family HTH domain